MGSTDSKQKLGERVLAARQKLSHDTKIQSERVNDIESNSPQTIKVILNSVTQSFKSCSPFLESILLIAWKLNPEKCSKIILDRCKSILNSPINKDEYEWFIKYVFPSSIWMFKNKKNRFMYEELIDIANDMQHNIINSMNSIYTHLEYHSEWKQILNIKNQTIVSRQDDKKVGLLTELEMKQVDDVSDDLQAFIDSNLAVNILTTTAKNINQEFQNYIETVMSHYGDVKNGPVKKVDRCVSKLENDYQKEVYPKAAKLLDLVRCSVTFNTVDQLVAGYDGLMRCIDKNSGTIELARVKNGFLNKEYSGGYRDIKVNVIYHSTINPDISMVCEVQLLLGQYLHEKKRIHKLYNIVRQKEYFKMTVTEHDEQQANTKNITELKFDPVLNVSEEVPYNNVHTYVGKCSVDSSLGLLAVESKGKISCIDIKEKKEIFSGTRETASKYVNQTHSWVVIDHQKYLAVQWSKNCIRFFKVKQDDKSFIEAKEYRICLDENDIIYSCEFDERFEHIFIVKNGNTLEKRQVKSSNNVLVSIELEKAIKQSLGMKILSLSNDGKWCVIGGGKGNSYFYLIEIDKKIQHKVTSTNLIKTYCPCFLNGDANFCVVGGDSGKIEIWDIKKRVLIKLLKMETTEVVGCLTSSNNILAVGTDDKKLSLWDIRTWKMFWCQQYEMLPASVHLTNDSKYFTIGGWHGEKCLVLAIK